MTAKRIITIALAILLVAVSVVSASAAQLTEDNPGGNTEVIANIKGAEPGDVTYIITIPDVVDFGTLTIPADNSSDYDKDVEYVVEATDINGLDQDVQAISVYVKDQNATADGDRNFYIANKDNSSIKFYYDVYNSTDTLNESTRVNNGDFHTKGYYLTSFDQEGQTMAGTLRFHQKQLYGQDVAEIAGDYSGYMVFFSTIESV